MVFTVNMLKVHVGVDCIAMKKIAFCRFFVNLHRWLDTVEMGNLNDIQPIACHLEIGRFESTAGVSADAGKTQNSI